MKPIPKEVMQKIEATASYLSGRINQNDFIETAHFGYQLANQEVERLEKEIVRLKELNEKTLTLLRAEIEISIGKVTYEFWQQFKTENNLNGK